MPVIAGKYIYIHMPKNGGVWMTKYLEGEHDGLLLPGHGHMPASEVPQHHRKDREMFGTIRDPWSWYTSWWSHALSNETTKASLAVYGGGSTEFADVMEGVLNPRSARAPARVSTIWDTRNALVERRDFLTRKVGLFSWTFDHIHGELVKKFIDMVQMPAGLDLLMGAHVDDQKYPPSNTKEQRLKKKRKINYKKLYTDKLAEMVWEADFNLIQRLGYTKPFKGAQKALVQI